MRSICSRLALAAILCAANAADAKPRRIVVLDFDGQRTFADIGRNTVMSLLGDQYDVVATRRWETVRAQANGHGPQQWAQAAKQAGVDAVIEGYVQDEGRHHVLTVVVREAVTGRELDSLSIRLGSSGLDGDQSRKLAKQLDEIFEWIDGDANTDAGSRLPDVRTVRPMLGAHQAVETKDTDKDKDDDDRDAGDDADDHQIRHRHKRHHRDIASADDGDDKQPATAEPAKPEPAKPEPPKADLKVAVADDPAKDTNDLVKLFGPDSKEADIVTDHKAKHVPVATPKIMISAGAYYASRGMTFDADPNASQGPPEYPASGITGLQLNAAVYPFPSQKYDGDLSGIGFTFAIAHSVGSVLTAMDDTGYGDYTLDHTMWDIGVHYRWPIDIVSVDIEASLGNDSHTIVDLPDSIQLPDTSVTYLGGGAHVYLHVTEHSSIGFGAKYLYVTSGGDINSEDWFGAGSAWGLVLDTDFTVPVWGPLFARGGIEYRRISFDFEGSGALAQQLGMWDAVDSSIGFIAQLGVKF